MESEDFVKQGSFLAIRSENGLFQKLLKYRLFGYILNGVYTHYFQRYGKVFNTKALGFYLNLQDSVIWNIQGLPCSSDSFYLCRLNQDSIIKPGRKLSINWLDKTKRGNNIYQLVYNDTVFTDNVICEVKLQKLSRFRYMLPEEGKLFVEQELKYSLERDEENNENTTDYSSAKDTENVNEINEKAFESQTSDKELDEFSTNSTQKKEKPNNSSVVDAPDNLERHTNNEQSHIENLDNVSKRKKHVESNVDLDESKHLKSLLNNEQQAHSTNIGTNPLQQENGKYILDHIIHSAPENGEMHINNEQSQPENLDVSTQEEYVGSNVDLDQPKNFKSLVNNEQQAHSRNINTDSLQRENRKYIVDHSIHSAPKNGEIYINNEQSHPENLDNISTQEEYVETNFDPDGHKNFKNHARKEQQSHSANLDTNPLQQKNGNHIILDLSAPENLDHANDEEQTYSATLDIVSQQQELAENNLTRNTPENTLLIESEQPKSVSIHIIGNIEYSITNNTDGNGVARSSTKQMNKKSNYSLWEIDENITSNVAIASNLLLQTKTNEALTNSENYGVEDLGIEDQLSLNLCESDDCNCIISSSTPPFCDSGSEYVPSDTERLPKVFNVLSFELKRPKKTNVIKLDESSKTDTSPLLLEQNPLSFKMQKYYSDSSDSEITFSKIDKGKRKIYRRKPRIPSIEMHDTTPPFCNSGSEYVPSDAEHVPKASNVLSFEPKRPKKSNGIKFDESSKADTSPLILEQEPSGVKIKSMKRRPGFKMQKESSDSTDSEIIFNKEEKGKQKIYKRKPRIPSMETYDTTNESESDDAIIISHSKKNDLNKRIYDKHHACIVCHGRFLKIARHLENKHSNNLEVARILAKPKKSAERRMGFLELQRCGDFHHNLEVLASKKGELILARRPSEKEAKDFNCFGPCPYCLGFMTKKRLWLHAKKCNKKKFVKDNESQKKSIQMESNAILNSILCKHTETEFKHKIIDSFRNDEISEICKSDEVIILFGRLLYEKYGNSQKELIRQNMRQLGRLLHEIHLNGHKQPLKYFISPENFDIIVQAVKLVSCANPQHNQRTEYGIPSLAMKLGYHLRKCASALRGQALRDADTSKDAKLKGFLDLLDLEWSVRISSNAILTMNNKKMNVAKLLPLTSDLVKLNKYLSEQIEYYKDLLTKQSSAKDLWYSLATLTLSRIILFNKRRGGEASRMQMTHYNSQTKWSDESTEEMQKTLSSFEKQLASELKLVQIPGKRGRTVPVLLTKEMVSAIELLISTRGSVGISTLNLYIFARIYNDSTESLRGSDCLRSVVQKAQLDSPNTITSTRLRKYVATVSQVFGLKEKEVDWLARHLGHDIRVHRDFYRLHDSAIELTKISRLLMAVDEGQVSTFEGKSLNDINLNDLPDIESENENDHLEDKNEEDLKSDDDDGDERLPLGIDAGENPASPLPTRKKPYKKEKNTGRTKNKVRPWGSAEAESVTKFFRVEIKNQIVPGKKRCDECKKKYGSVLDSRTWKDIKYYVKNHITRIKKIKK